MEEQIYTSDDDLDEPMGQIEIVEDFLPRANQLIFKTDTPQDHETL